MYTLTITGLALSTVIGAYAWEQQITQTVLLDLAITADLAAAAMADDITQTIDYSALTQHVIAFARTHQHALIESLAYHLQQELVRTFPTIQQLQLTLHKPGAIAKAKSVAITLTWGR